MEQHLEDLFSHHRQTLRQMQSSFHGANCPAVATSVHNFLLTGESHRAARNINGGFICTPPLHTRDSISGFVSMVAGGAIGNCAVIGTFGGRPSHYFNLVNLNGSVYFVDAFPSNPVFRLQAGDLISGYNRFEFYRNFSCERSA